MGLKKITKMRYSLVNRNVLPLPQWPEGITTSSWRPLPLAEHFKICSKPAEALGVVTKARHKWCDS